MSTEDTVDIRVPCTTHICSLHFAWNRCTVYIMRFLGNQRMVLFDSCDLLAVVIHNQSLDIFHGCMFTLWSSFFHYFRKMIARVRVCVKRR